ncbi:MAG TPA: hypothetical protein VN253_29780 [Kofleriaceae bacterium]|nr:hypothetical protein [Kofleriaceae bacterium]
MRMHKLSIGAAIFAMLYGLAAAPALAEAPPSPTAPATGTPVPSGSLKAYKGPEGEVIAMVEVSDGKEMLVHYKNVGSGLDGKTLRYLLEDHGSDKTVYLNYKRGSKWHRTIILDARDRKWEFYHPTKSNVHFAITYSESASEKLKLEDVLKAYKP